MKIVFKIFLYLFSTFAILLISLVIFLNIYYGILERRETKRVLASRSLSSGINPLTTQTQGKADTAIINLIPVPQKAILTGGTFKMPAKLVYSVADSLSTEAGIYLRSIPSVMAEYSPKGGNIKFIINSKLPSQGYILIINSQTIGVEYSTLQGLWYAVVSLKVLNQNYHGLIPCVSIEDFPDLETRGLMVDISRDKVPTRETLLQISQLLSDLKFNHLELYIEGLSFAYPSFSELWEGKETPVTGEDIRALDSFCRSHFIDLVPNQNMLGHMMQWLDADRFRDLAECPKGYKLMGLISMKSTLDPVDPRSIELVTRMTDDLLPNFSSSNFNVNLDEPFELGKGKSKELVSKVGIGKVYFDYAMKMHDIAVARNKKMLMWADIVLKHPDMIPEIPKNITLLDWGYEAGYPYEKHCKILHDSGLDYMVCPGTNSWTTITGRTDNMLATIESAASNGFKYGAKGLLLTDWGDMGHWQYLPVSYPGYVTGAALSWNSKSAGSIPLAGFLDSFVFRDKSKTMGNLVLDLGRYCNYEEFLMFNMTSTMVSFQFGLRDKLMADAIFGKMIKELSGLMGDIAPDVISDFKKRYNSRKEYDYQGLMKFLDSKESLLKKAEVSSADSSIIKDEYLNAIKLVRLGADLKEIICNKDSYSHEVQGQKLGVMRDLCTQYLQENKRLWLLRNKPGGYDRSTASLTGLILQIDKQIQLINGPAPARWLNRFLERTGTAGAALYMKMI